MKDELKNLCLKLAYAVDQNDAMKYEVAKQALEPHRAELERLAKTKGQDQATAKAALALLDPKKDEGVGFDLGGGSTKEPSKPEKKPDEKKAAEGGEEPPKDNDGKLEVNVLNTVETNPPDGELPPELQPEVEDPAPRPVRAGGGDDGPRQPRRREANEEGGGLNWWWLVLLIVLVVIAVLVGQKIGGSGAPTPSATATPATPPAMTKEDLVNAYKEANEEARKRDLEAVATELDKTTQQIKATDKTEVKSVNAFKTCAEDPNSADCLVGEADAHKFYGDLSPKKAVK